jgi:hypothetical protein
MQWTEVSLPDHISSFNMVYFIFRVFEVFFVDRVLIMLNAFICAAGVTVEVKNWPPFFPIIHHDITNEIPIYVQKLQYTEFASWLGIFPCIHIPFFCTNEIVSDKVHLIDKINSCV